jgi:adenosylcobinamide-GDP ribazoletransferase
MHDSQAGNFAILALLLLSAGRICALAALDAPERVFLALLVAASLSRAAVVVVMHILPPARSDGLSAGAGQPTLNITFAAILIAAAIALLTLGFVAALACMAAAAVAAALVAVTARRRLGGQTGDVLGAVQNITEFSCLFAAGLAFLWLLGGGYLF